MQLEIGLPRSFLSYSHAQYGPLVTRSWIAATWKFLSDSKITVFDPFPKPELATPADRFLMEGFFASGYRGVELRNLNHCRLHMHALLVSDLCTADGQCLTSDAMEVQLDDQRQPPFTWPRTYRPEFAIRSLWRAALTKSFLRSTDSQILVLPL
jgi:hypothetical protein